MLMVYNEENNKHERIAKYWGYCDGVNVFSKLTPYPMSRFGNTFEFFIDKEEYHAAIMEYRKLKSITQKIDFESTYINHIFLVLNILTSGTLDNVEPVQLDMETGRIY